jgi:hypothetical protein
MLERDVVLQERNAHHNFTLPGTPARPSGLRTPCMNRMTLSLLLAIASTLGLIAALLCVRPFG